MPPLITLKSLRFILAGLVAAAPWAAQAGPATDALSQCLTDSTSGKDRKDLAKWVFVGMAAHPEMRPLAAIGPDQAESAQKTMGDLVTRLIGTACKEPMRAAVKADGSDAARAAFEHLGRIAMQELMTNPQVNAAIGGFERHVDKKAIEAATSAQ